MKKKLLFLLILLITSKFSFSQSYYVTYIKGSVLYNHKPLKLHDQISDQTKVSSDQKSAELGLFSLKKGKLMLSFLNSKLVAVAGPGHSELYELIVGNYLQKYTQNKILGTKGADRFDLQLFLNDTVPNPINQIVLIEGQTLPLQSNLMKFMPDDKYFICRINKKETVCNSITKTGNSLSFDNATLKSLISDTVHVAHCVFKIGYTDNGVYQEQYFPDALEVAVLSHDQLSAIVASYKPGLTDYYHGDKNKLVADVEDDLTDHYGKLYNKETDRIILDLLN